MDIDLFISHATADDAIVSKIHHTLEVAGLKVWVDHEDRIGPGDEWPMQIHQAANACRAGLFVMSVNSVQSVYCTAEWQRILDRGIRLYLVLIEDIPLEQIPLRLGIIQYLDLRLHFEEGLAQLAAAIQGERALDAQHASVGQVRQLSGAFPHAALDIPLIGRNEELTQVRAALADGHRVTAITGLGGVGKTRLAAEIASTADFRDGVVWHTISPESSLMHLTLLIRDHLRLDKTVDDEATWQALGQQQVLLVLDNAEDCRQPAAYAERIHRLDLSGGTRVLMTSRQQWSQLRGKVFDLRVPDEEDAVQILRAMAEKEPPAFPPDGYEEQLAKAARQHPRLMEYAIRWLDTYPPDYVLEILSTLEGADAEEILDDIVRKTIEQVRSQAGGEDAVAALRRLAVCRGGFTFEAARAITDNPRALATLKQWGLVRLDEGRYDVDPLIIKAIGVDESAYEPHYNYYKVLAQEHDEKQGYLALDVESANLEAAFEWAMQSGAFESAYWLANTCSDFLSNRGRFRQRANWMIRLKEALADYPDHELQAAFQIRLGLAYSALAQVEAREANLRRAIAAYEAALQYYTPQIAPLDYAATQNNLGTAYSDLAQVEAREVNLRRAIAAYEAALQYYTPQIAPLDYAQTITNLGLAQFQQGNLSDACANWTEAEAIYRDAGLTSRADQIQDVIDEVCGDTTAS